MIDFSYADPPLKAFPIQLEREDPKDTLAYISPEQTGRIKVVALTEGQKVIPVLENAKAQGEPFDLCISDIRMPGISGYDVGRQIRNSGASFADIPMIALSSLLERDAKKCEEVGFDGFLPKPIHRDKLYQLVSRILGKKEEKEGRSMKPMRESLPSIRFVRRKNIQ